MALFMGPGPHRSTTTSVPGAGRCFLRQQRACRVSNPAKS